MEIILVLLIICSLAYQFGKRKGYTKGRNERMEINKITWYRKGMNKIKEEIYSMKNLNDKEILYRLKEMIKKKKN